MRIVKGLIGYSTRFFTYKEDLNKNGLYGDPKTSSNTVILILWNGFGPIVLNRYKLESSYNLSLLCNDLEFT